MHIFNAQTEGLQHKSMVEPELKAEGCVPPGQTIALQVINALKEPNFSDEIFIHCTLQLTVSFRVCIPDF